MTEQSPLPFTAIIQAATEEQWEVVDANIQYWCNNPSILQWVFDEGISHTDDNVRDLAVSVIEKSDHVPTPQEQSAIVTLMKHDTNPFVTYRAAFALYKRKDRSGSVMEKMCEALAHPDTKDVAERYLSSK